jgi:hypothetical protein
VEIHGCRFTGPISRLDRFDIQSKIRWLGKQNGSCGHPRIHRVRLSLNVEGIDGQCNRAGVLFVGQESDVRRGMRKVNFLGRQDSLRIGLHNFYADAWLWHGRFEFGFDAIVGFQNRFFRSDTKSRVFLQRIGFEVVASAAVESFGFQGSVDALDILIAILFLSEGLGETDAADAVTISADVRRGKRLGRLF